MCAERRRRPAWRRRVGHFIVIVEVLALLVSAVVLGVLGGTFYSVSRVLPSEADIMSYRPTEGTQIISSDGVVLAEVYEENRELVDLPEIPQHLQNATVAIEDERFYRHFGIDPRGIARAIVENLRHGGVRQGGSTITQQLARNIYLSREKKLSRKLQEMVLAIQLERNYSKQEILELYLNQIYYGSGAHGVQTASKIYFGKPVQQLSLSECALLAGLPQKPSVYSPHENLELAIRRRNVVLDRMRELGYITSEELEKAKASVPRIVARSSAGLARYKAPWFVTYVIKELTKEYGADLVYRGGLRVHTTLNYEMQEIAERELRKGVAAAKARRVSQGALICIDPHTGYIRAMVGGVNPDFSKDQFNRAVQARRQPGSAFKAFVYTAAIDNGYPPDYRLSNARKTYPGYGQSGWTPRNYDGRYGGTYTIKMAVAKSVNVCAVRMAEEVGIDQVIMYARLLGIKSPLSRNLALALGASEVTPLEICSAYGVFAANGLRAEPMAIVRIATSRGDRDGSIIAEKRPAVRRVLSEQTAQTMNEIFRAVVTSGTGYAAARVPEARGKTGTTQNDRTAWFVGYTPELSTAVYVGNDDNSPMRNVWGGNVCAPIWSEFMLKALDIHRKEQAARASITDSDNEHRSTQRTRAERERRTESDRGRKVVTLCTESGRIATEDCPNTYQVTVGPDDAPLGKCPIHGRPDETGMSSPQANPVPQPQPAPPESPTGPPRPPSTASSAQRYVTVMICVDSGMVANEYCPEKHPRQYRSDEAPTKVCRMHGPPRR